MSDWSATRGRLLCMALLAALTASCGGSSPSPIPTPLNPIVTAVSPNSGTTLGGTQISISGSNFAAGATVTIGGSPATNVVIVSTTAISALTGQRAAGTVEVTVGLDGRIGTLPAAFTYVAPQQITNEPPAIQSVSARGARANEPENFADLNEEITVAAVVTDKETAPDRLVYEWSGTDGTFSGVGPSVKWRAPASGATPFVANLKLVVVDRFQTTDGSGVPITFEHRVEKPFTVKVHDSIKEVGDMATKFLQNFSISTVPASVVMQDFLVGCYGTAEERRQVEENREKYTITSYTVGPATVSVNFGGVCAFRGRSGDACSNSPVRWASTEIATGNTGATEGTDQVTAVYRDSRWWLCDSQFDGHPAAGSTTLGFYRLLTRDQ